MIEWLIVALIVYICIGISASLGVFLAFKTVSKKYKVELDISFGGIILSVVCWPLFLLKLGKELRKLRK